MKQTKEEHLINYFEGKIAHHQAILDGLQQLIDSTLASRREFKKELKIFKKELEQLKEGK